MESRSSLTVWAFVFGLGPGSLSGSTDDTPFFVLTQWFDR